MRALPEGQSGTGTSAGGGKSCAFQRPLPSSPFTRCLPSSSLLTRRTPLICGLGVQWRGQYEISLQQAAALVRQSIGLGG